MVAHVLNLSTLEEEAGVSLWVWGYFDLQRKFQDSQDCIERPYLQIQNKNWNVVKIILLWGNGGCSFSTTGQNAERL